MVSKKLLLTGLFLLLFNLNNKNGEIDLNLPKNHLNSKTEIKIENSNIERDKRKNNFFKEETKKDDIYLEKNTEDIPQFKNENYLKDKINKYTYKLHHASGKIKLNDSDFYKIKELSLHQLQRIYLVLNSLQDSAFRNELGRIIEKDVLDKYAEHGGIILFKKNKIYFKTLESYLSKDTLNNEFYGPPEKKILYPNIGDFHLHATSYNEKNYANPSLDDLIISFYTAQLDKESHDFLITPLKKGIFNVDYYGGIKDKDGSIKVFDLGNYQYDTLSINDTSKIFK
jgi:hypothetical protein